MHAEGRGRDGTEAGPTGTEVLRDVPVALQAELLRAVRRAVDRLERSELPVGLRPFARFTPRRLADERPRSAVADALATSARLREAVGEALDDRALWESAGEADVGRLVAEHGEEQAVAALTARARWSDLALLAARAGERLAARERAAAEARPQPAPQANLGRRGNEEVGTLRSERDAARRRADAAEQRARRAEAEVARLAGAVEQLTELRDELQRRLADERRTTERRYAALRRRATVAEEQARAETARVAGALEALAAGLRTAGGPSSSADGSSAAPAPSAAPSPVVEASSAAGSPVPQASAAPAPRDASARGTPPSDKASSITPGMPRTVQAARGGRPSQLPPGVAGDEPLAVRALLAVPGIEVLLDGYNVTKDVTGRPTAALEVQRRWLVSLAAGVAARFGRRITVVFDGTEALPASSVTPPGVRVCFSVGDELADSLLVALVAELDPGQPVLVVTSDRQVRSDVAALGADVAASRAFLAVAGA